MKTLSILAVPALLVLVACNNEPASKASKAQVGAAVAASSAAPAEAQHLAFSQADSKLEFVGAKITATHDGAFKEFQGQLHFDAAAPEKSKVEVTIQIGSLAIEPAQLAGHLKSPDFFDAQKFPTAHFESTSIARSPEGYTVTGNLELHGVKKSISFPASLVSTGGDPVFKAEFSINRKDFGIVYPGMPDDLIKDQVLIKLELKPHKA